MKKLIYCAAALATALFAGSCQRELLDPAQGGSTVTFTVNVPEVTTKATIGDGDHVDNLVYAVYRVLNTQYTDQQAKENLINVLEQGQTDYQLIYQEDQSIQNGNSVVSLELINDQRYVVIFWAQKGYSWFREGEQFVSVPYPTTQNGNMDAYDAFTDIDVVSVDGSISKNITLVRPFAQLNIATSLPNTDRYQDFAVSTTGVKVSGLASSFNVGTQKGVVENSTVYEVTFRDAEPLTENFTNSSFPEYISMNYVFVPDNKTNVKVTYDINTNNYGTVHNVIENVPVARNYRTNIIGNLLTSNVRYSVELAPWATNNNSGNTKVLADGVVINQNGDYEISNENGLAYAIENLFAEGGNFYLTAALYDMTDYDVNTPSVPEKIVLNIYGETPVVTRSTKTVAGVTIKGLTDAFIGTVNGAVSVSGVNLSDANSVLVEKNEGTVVISETSAKTIIADGTPAVEADNVTDFANLNKALASDVKVIELGAYIEATDVIQISRSVTINGNNNSIISPANRIIRLTASNIEVVINDLNGVSSAAVKYPSDVRGISIDQNLSNVDLTLNNCTIDFTDITANDWTYAVNVSGNGTGHNVTINGGTYEGANVVNAHSAKNTITVKNATLNCMYPASELYTGACIWVLQNQESSVYAEGNTFNGSNALAFNLGTGTALEEKDNTDNTQYYRFKSGANYFYTLDKAIESVESTGEVKVLNDASIASTSIPAGKTITLDLNGKTVRAIDTTEKNFELIKNKGTLVIKNTAAETAVMTVEATINSGWNRYSAVVANEVGGFLTVEGNVVLEHLGGTDMAYGIDNLTNGKGTSAVTTINGATVKSPYRAVRQFLNGVEATNSLTVKSGSKLYGDNKSIFFHDPSTKANKGTLVIEEGVELYGDVYLFVTAGSTEWPVSVSISESALKNDSEVVTGNVPEGYTVENVGGVWQVIPWTTVATADELVAALEANQNVIFANDIKIEPASMSNAYGTTGINVKYGQTIDGNGYTLNIKGAGGTWDSGINTTGGLIKNITVTGSYRGIFINHTSTYSEKVILENVTIGGNGTVYTISCDQGLYQGIEATNCTFNGWTSFAKTAGEAKFEKCTFGEGSGYKYCRPYSNTEFVNCTFRPGYAVDETQAKVTFTNCTWEE